MKDENRDHWRRKNAEGRMKDAKMRRPDPTKLGEWAKAVREIVDQPIADSGLRIADCEKPPEGGTPGEGVRLPYPD